MTSIIQKRTPCVKTLFPSTKHHTKNLPDRPNRQSPSTQSPMEHSGDKNVQWPVSLHGFLWRLNMPPPKKSRGSHHSPAILVNRICIKYIYIYIIHFLTNHKIHKQKTPNIPHNRLRSHPHRPPTCVHISQRPNGPSSMPLHTSEFCWHNSLHWPGEELRGVVESIPWMDGFCSGMMRCWDVENDNVWTKCKTKWVAFVWKNCWVSWLQYKNSFVDDSNLSKGFLTFWTLKQHRLIIFKEWAGISQFHTSIRKRIHQLE